MTRADLELLHDAGAFNPAPRHQALYATHVPFDTMTRSRGCEQALAAALRRQAALTLTLDDPDAERIERRHVELAFAEAAG